MYAPTAMSSGQGLRLRLLLLFERLMGLNADIERICNRSLAILDRIPALLGDGDTHGELSQSVFQLNWDHIQLWALIDAIRNVN